ncbi:MAG: hypothetical protein AAGA75_21460 [Cyanobacteria bacterium P01_E01_bin.6]
MSLRFIGLLAVLTFGVLGFRGCFDSEPSGIKDWTSVDQISRNGFWVFSGVFERFVIFSEKQSEVQTLCAGVQDVNCDGVVEDGEGSL